MNFPAEYTPRKTAVSLGKLSRKWLDPENPWRRKALRAMRRDFPGAMGEKLLDALFSELTEKKLLELLKRDAGLFRGMRGALVVHVVPANVPNPSVTSMVLGLLAGSLNAVKISKRDSGLLRVYLESLRAHDARLAGAAEIFSSHQEALRRMRSASLVTAYGDDGTIAYLKRHTPKGVPFAAHGHRVSVAVFAKEALGARLARAAAYDAWMMDRRGCMSPEVFFVQDSGRMSARDFADTLGGELEKLYGGMPRTFAQALRLKARRDRERLDAAKGARVNPRVPVRSFRTSRELFGMLAPYRGKLQVAAVEAPPALRGRWAAALTRLGASRICRAGRMQHPPIAWDL